jgi:ABC transport system ATP-binding/permease protein
VVGRLLTNRREQDRERTEMPILDAQNLTKRLGDRVLLESVFLTLRRGERVGLVGENGSGKSTLAKVLAGLLDSDGGVVHRRRDATISYLPQAPTFSEHETALDHVFLGRPAWFEVGSRLRDLNEKLARGQANLDEVSQAAEEFEHAGGYGREAEAERLLVALGIRDFRRELRTMSGGEGRRVALARLLFSDPDFAILDEPTNHLDAENIEWLEQYLLDTFRGGYLLITHDRFLLNRVVDRTLEIERGRVFSYEGGWEEYLIARAEREAAEARTEANRQNFLRKEIEWLRRQPKARTTKQKARVNRGEAALQVNAPKARTRIEFEAQEMELGTQVLETENLTLGRGERVLIRDLNLRVSKGMRLGIVGPSGSGKTTLLLALLGMLEPTSGTIVRGASVKVAYLDQMRTNLDLNETVYESALGNRPSVTLGSTELGGYTYLSRFGFDGPATRQKVGALSGGERARLALARLLLEPANLLVLDEPSNDLDVMTLGSLEDLLLGLTGSLLLVSHDRYFLDRVATHILAYEGEGQFRLWVGGFSYYAELRQAELAARSLRPKEAIQEPLEPKTAAARSEPLKKLTYAEEKELGGLLDKIEKATSAVMDLETKLNDPTLYAARPLDAPLLQKELEKARDEVKKLEDRWLSLEERKSATATPR